MKKRILVVVFTILVIISVFAQSGDNASRLVGIWVNSNGSNDRWVFSANGTLTRSNDTARYGVTETMLAILTSSNSASRVVIFYSYSISSDGRTLILYRTEGDGIYGIWLTKQ